MGKTNQHKSNKRTVNDHGQYKSVMQESDDISYRFSVGLAVCAMAGVLVFSFLFFLTDIPQRIAQANVPPAHAESNAPNNPANQTNDDRGGYTDRLPFHILVASDGSVDKESFIRYLDSLPDADFQSFMNEVRAKTDPNDFSALVKTKTFFERLSTGDLSGKRDILNYLRMMTPAEFNGFIMAAVKSISPDQADELSGILDEHRDSNESENGALGQQDHPAFESTLDAAYAEAERLYPGKINASNRLKLIQDVRSSGYLYYVAEQGDTLIELSRAFHVSLGELVEINGIRDADVIHAGDIILFPEHAVQPDIGQ